ncbi:MAG: hypothetical protein QXM22_00400 [Candidatus Bathyarchaeia archaeon]
MVRDEEGTVFLFSLHYPRWRLIFTPNIQPVNAPIIVFNAGTWNNGTFYVEVISPSIVTNLDFVPVNKTLSFDVEGTNGTVGFCRVMIPLGLMWCDDHNQ